MPILKGAKSGSNLRILNAKLRLVEKFFFSNFQQPNNSQSLLNGHGRMHRPKRLMNNLLNLETFNWPRISLIPLTSFISPHSVYFMPLHLENMEDGRINGNWKHFDPLRTFKLQPIRMIQNFWIPEPFQTRLAKNI